MDFKFWSMFTLTAIGLGFMAVQTRLMKHQISSAPSPKSAKRAAFERTLVKRLYLPVFIMGGLVLLNWLPYVLAYRSPVLPNMLTSWGSNRQGCRATVNTAPLAKVGAKYRVFLACRVEDSAVDGLEDDAIAISKPFGISGGIVDITVLYEPNSKIVSKIAPQPAMAIISTDEAPFLLPEDVDGSQVRKLSDIERLGGQLVLPGMELNKH